MIIAIFSFSDMSILRKMSGILRADSREFSVATPQEFVKKIGGKRIIRRVSIAISIVSMTSSIRVAFFYVL